MTSTPKENSRSLLKPFAALRPADAHAAEVAAPPYDVLNAEETRTRAGEHPESFLHISRPEADFPPGTDPYAPAVYAKAAETMNRMIASGVLVRDSGPAFYVYRMRAGGRTQTGIAGAASVAAYDRDRIRRHELTRPEKEDDRVRQIEAVNAHTGPVFLVHRSDAGVAAVTGRVQTRTPDQSITGDNGVVHDIWVVNDTDSLNRLSRGFDAMEALYIADGHHRAAAASRVAASRRKANPNHQGDEPYTSFLAVSFPDDEVRILDYNRAVRDLNGLSAKGFLEMLDKGFAVDPDPKSPRPARGHEFGMYLAGRWYRLSPKDLPAVEDDPTPRLDVNLLSGRVLAPILGVGDPRTDERLEFIGANQGLEGLVRRVDDGSMAVAFVLHPTALADLIAVVDSGGLMPPKSTWFDPKLADGLLSLVLD